MIERCMSGLVAEESAKVWLEGASRILQERVKLMTSWGQRARVAWAAIQRRVRSKAS